MARIGAGDVHYKADILGRITDRLHPEARLVSRQCRWFRELGFIDYRRAAVYGPAKGHLALTNAGWDAMTVAR